MAGSAISINFSAILAASATVANRQFVTLDASGYRVPATKANRAARSGYVEGITLSAASGSAGTVAIPVQTDGPVELGLGTGAVAPLGCDDNGNPVRQARDVAAPVYGLVLADGSGILGTNHAWSGPMVDLTKPPYNCVADSNGAGGGTDNYAAIQQAIDDSGTLPNGWGRTLCLPKGRYRVSDTLHMSRRSRLVGDGGEAGSAATIIDVASGKTGLFIDYNQTAGTARGDWSTVEHINFYSLGGTGGPGPVHGVHYQYQCKLMHVGATNFSGSGFYSDAYILAAPYGSSNIAMLMRCYAQGSGSHGFYIHGDDANHVMFLQCQAIASGGHGFYDASFLGCQFIGCHAATSTLAGYYQDRSTAYNGCFVGCYSETDNQISHILQATVLGGNLASQLTSTSTAPVFGQGCRNVYSNDTNVAAGISALSPLRSYLGHDDGKTYLGFKSGNEGAVSCWGPSDAMSGMPVGWHSFGYNNNNVQQTYATPGPNAKWPSGGSLSLARFPFWVFDCLAFGPYNSDPRMQDYGSAAPASGYWVRGSIRWNNSAAVGQPIGWQCTVTGTPGTWVAMTNL